MAEITLPKTIDELTTLLDRSFEKYKIDEGIALTINHVTEPLQVQLEYLKTKYSDALLNKKTTDEDLRVIFSEIILVCRKLLKFSTPVSADVFVRREPNSEDARKIHMLFCANRKELGRVHRDDFEVEMGVFIRNHDFEIPEFVIKGDEEYKNKAEQLTLFQLFT